MGDERITIFIFNKFKLHHCIGHRAACFLILIALMRLRQAMMRPVKAAATTAATTEEETRAGEKHVCHEGRSYEGRSLMATLQDTRLWRHHSPTLTQDVAQMELHQVHKYAARCDVNDFTLR